MPLAVLVLVSYLMFCVAPIWLAWFNNRLSVAGNSWKVAIWLLGSWTLPALCRRRELLEPPRGRIRGDHWRTQLHHEVRSGGCNRWMKPRMHQKEQEWKIGRETARENKERQRVQMRSAFYPHHAYYVSVKLSHSRLCVTKLLLKKKTADVSF